MYTCVGILLSVFILALLPYAHFGVLFELVWPKKPVVDRHSCTCGCWDTVFNATFQKGIVFNSYRHIYFNVTPQTLNMWTLTIVAVLLTYECVVYVVRVALRSKIRSSMLFLLLTAIHSHYYSWWVFIGYYNDDFYTKWWHQLTFTLTEMASTVVVVSQIDKAVPISPRALLFIASIALFHIMATGRDQFVESVLQSKGKFHQQYRDAAFMAGDVVLLNISSMELVRLLCRKNGARRRNYRTLKRDVLLSAIVIAGLLVVLACVVDSDLP
ncbi:uncharacterized protein [Branchiostoma lanceolatum]|uniref:uncharacterized protein n=1 Tax=Branchiostoma lanceolatum TaxID=7740 RepID=UPI003452AEBB